MPAPLHVSFVERLTIASWFFSVWLRLCWWRINGDLRDGVCFIIDARPWTMRVARAMGRLVGVRIEHLEFRLIDVKDCKGTLWRLRIAFELLAEYQRLALGMPVFVEYLRSMSLRERQLMFLAKNLVAGGFQDPLSVWRAIYLAHVCDWKLRSLGAAVVGKAFFLESFPWIGAVRAYAAGLGLTTVIVWPWYRTERRVRNFAHHAVVALKRLLAFRRYARSRPLPGMAKERNNPTFSLPATSVQQQPTRRSTARLAVPYYGQFNLDRPELYSDLYFLQQSKLPASSLLVLFNLPQDPLDDKKLAELGNRGIDALALHAQAATASGAAVYPDLGLVQRARNLAKAVLYTFGDREKAWLKIQSLDYARQYEYWRRLFEARNVKIFTSWYKYDANHLPLAEALSDAGGVMTVYQRAYESHPSPEMTLGVNVEFGFSRTGAELEQRSNSVIPYYVVTGYLGDHRFQLVRTEAQKIRATLQAQGARRILAFFDENTVDDSRWYSGHEVIREDYAFLLEKVLADPALGLILKPKVPGSLRRRLGPVAELLSKAEATGRCYVFEAGLLHGSFPPAVAAMAADLAVHEELWAATAGLESALAGVPTLLLDREGWLSSPLYQLGIGGSTGGAVFHDWSSLWRTCKEHWSRPGGIPGLGDWSLLLEELDPFRDGRAAERMGTYLGWLVEGFDAGMSRDTVLADAAERYCRAWGRDKVVEVKPASSYATDLTIKKGAIKCPR